MAVERMDNVPIVVDDLESAIAFFSELGLGLEGRAPIEGIFADLTVGLEGVRTDIAMMRTPDGHGRLELTQYHHPRPAAAPPQAPAPNCSARWRTTRASTGSATCAGRRGSSSRCAERTG